ncbi:MAG TPA: hypothetical protein DCQ93_10450 [Bacteroidetes bacterium]|nr:hypothetical protein [Bacteroidota bacterium]
MTKRILAVAFLLLTFQFLILTLSLSRCSAQSFIPNSGARSVALGFSEHLFGDAYSVFANPASLAWLEKPTVVIGSSQRFFMKELSSAGAGFAYPMKNSALGLNLNYYGFSSFSRKCGAISYTQKITENIAFAAKLDYLQTSINEYGINNAVTGELGVAVKVTKDLNFGMHAFNPFLVSGGYFTDERIPTGFSLGLNYKLADQLLLIAESSKELNSPGRLHTGLEYKPAEKIFLRGGFSTHPFEYGFGLGFQFKNWMVDAASAYHVQLGYSPCVTLKYSFSKK